jgi:cytochrome c-type biogenesis protein
VSGQVDIIAAFGAGVLSFLSPCVLPLIPGYLSFLGGSTAGSDATPATRRNLVFQALLFVAGFSIVFIVLGASASAVGAALAPYKPVLSRVAGVVVFAFGFLLLGVVKAPWLYGERRFDPARARGLWVWAAPVMGMAFGFGWTPCVGPILGSILTLAAQEGSVARAVLLLFVYSAGLGLPFVLAAALLGRMTPLLRFLGRHSLTISRVSGVVLMALGATIATGTLAQVVGLLSRWVSGGAIG